MYHSITFGDKNTWDDWCLIPNGRPIFVPPTQKTNYLDIPGGNGSLDMSEALTGYPVFNDREGSFSFIIMNKGASMYPECDPNTLDGIYETILSYLHGKTMRAVLEDDPMFFYKGRFAVGSITPGADWSTIEIAYHVEPYKYSILSTTDSWLWDPFSFKNGIILNATLSNIVVSTASKTIKLNRKFIGEKPVVPKFIVSSTNGQGVWIQLFNPNLGINTTTLFQNGEQVDNDYILYGDDVTLQLFTSSGSGTVSVEFYPGRL